MPKKQTLNSVAESFINKKTSRSQNRQTSEHQEVIREQQTTYLTPEIRKRARVHAAETGETISELIERLLVGYFKNK